MGNSESDFQLPPRPGRAHTSSHQRARDGRCVVPAAGEALNGSDADSSLPLASAARAGGSTAVGSTHDLLAVAIQALPDPVLITDADRRTLVRNRRATELLTCAPDADDERRQLVELNNARLAAVLASIGRDAPATGRELSLVDPDDGATILFDVMRSPLEPPRQAAPSRAADGETGVGRPSARPARGGTSPAGGAAELWVLRDVTELRRAAAQLERQIQLGRRAEIAATRERDRLDMILEHVADPIIVSDARSNIVRMNREAESLFLADERELSPASTGKRSNFRMLREFIGAVLAGSESEGHGELTLVAPDGSPLPVEIVSGKISDGGAMPVAVVSVLHDLTKQVENERLYEELKRFSSELEDRVRLATADLERQNARLQWQSHELEKANRLKSEFLASMSHELRTPINALLGYTALMLDRIFGDLTEQQENGLERIRVSARHLLELINDILDLAKIEAGKMPVHLGSLRLELLMRELQLQVEPLLSQRQVTLEVEFPDDAPALFTDATKVKQILLNLLSNAAKFTHHGRVLLRATVHGERVTFEVTDSGIGIRPEELAAIWDDFRQVDQSRTREYGGTGLGLSITRKLVDRLEGTIEVSSEYGVGSTFVVSLPLREPARVVESFRRQASGVQRALPQST